jgi:hypothetical protein
MYQCHLKEAVEVQVPLKIMVQEVMRGGFQKCFKQL